MFDQRNRKQSIVTRVAQALHFVEAETGAVTPSIQPSATYARDDNYEIRQRHMRKQLLPSLKMQNLHCFFRQGCRHVQP